MVRYENNKRVCARGITFIDDSILLIERYKREDDSLLHYYSIPGGGVEDNESLEEAAIRETKEETTIDTKMIKFLEKEEYNTGIVYWFMLEYLSGTPLLGGEELERNNPDNSYKVVLIKMKDIDQINILGEGKRIVKECFKDYQERRV